MRIDSDGNSVRRRRRRKKKKAIGKLIPVLIAIVLIFIISGIGIASFLIEKFSYSTEQMDLKKYFNLKDDVHAAIVYGDEIQDTQALIIDGSFYLSMDAVHRYLNTRFYEDKGEEIVLYTTPNETFRTQIGERGYTDGLDTKNTDFIPARYEGDSLYLCLDYVRLFTNFTQEVYEDPVRIQLYGSWGEIKTARVNTDSAIRYQGGVKSDILVKMDNGEEVTILEELEDWDKVKAKGCIGYIEKKHLSDVQQTAQKPETYYQEPVYTNQLRDHRINLGWHQVISTAANDTLDSVLKNTTGLNVISPTWYSLSDNEGNIKDISSSSYVLSCHGRGLEVWALVDNFSENVDTFSILSSTSRRAVLINNLVSAAMKTAVDGINVDFEQLTVESGPHFAQFIRELSVACRAQGLVLSVDNYVPIGNTEFYHREVQGEVADYVIIMGYDEHWNGSEEAGSVASINYTETGIVNTLTSVPAEKIINGIPFYTRIWQTKGGVLSSEAVDMQTAEQFLSNHGQSAVWNEETCQNYAEFEENGTFYQVWMEDEQSIQAKLGVMTVNGIAGVAEWKLGMEKPSVWNVIDAYVQGGLK